MNDTTKILCDHGYVMLQDSCPNCDHMQETAHAATTVRVNAPWGKRPFTRCTACQQPASASVHRELT